jgi:hypothetical protein
MRVPASQRWYTVSPLAGVFPSQSSFGMKSSVLVGSQSPQQRLLLRYIRTSHLVSVDTYYLGSPHPICGQDPTCSLHRRRHIRTLHIWDTLPHIAASHLRTPISCNDPLMCLLFANIMTLSWKLALIAQSEETLTSISAPETDFKPAITSAVLVFVQELTAIVADPWPLDTMQACVVAGSSGLSDLLNKITEALSRNLRVIIIVFANGRPSGTRKKAIHSPLRAFAVLPLECTIVAELSRTRSQASKIHVNSCSCGRARDHT